jgi:hypothetical protein
MRILTATSVLLGVGSLLAQPAAALAKINFGESIEWIVVDSDRIVSGTIAKIAPYAPDPRWDVVTVKIDKTFKGTPAETATFLVTPQWGPIAKDWQAVGKPMLFFLVKNEFKDKNDPLAKYEWRLREGRLAYATLFLGEVNKDWVETRTMLVFTREYDVLTRSDEITKRVEKVVADTGKSLRRQSYQVEVPWDSPAHKELYSGSTVYLILPVGEKFGAKRTDIQLEKHKASFSIRKSRRRKVSAPGCGTPRRSAPIPTRATNGCCANFSSAASTWSALTSANRTAVPRDARRSRSSTGKSSRSTSLSPRHVCWPRAGAD